MRKGASPPKDLQAQVRMLHVGRLHNGDETRVQTHDCCAALAGRVQRIARPKARLVFEEVSLVHGLVGCSIALLPHLLLAASRRNEVEATTRRLQGSFSQAWPQKGHCPSRRQVEKRGGEHDVGRPLRGSACSARARRSSAAARCARCVRLAVHLYYPLVQWLRNPASGQDD